MEEKTKYAAVVLALLAGFALFCAGRFSAQLSAAQPWQVNAAQVPAPEEGQPPRRPRRPAPTPRACSPARLSTSTRRTSTTSSACPASGSPGPWASSPGGRKTAFSSRWTSWRRSTASAPKFWTDCGITRPSSKASGVTEKLPQPPPPAAAPTLRGG